MMINFQPWQSKLNTGCRILVGIGGGGGLPVIGIDNVARETAEEAITAVEALTAQVGDVIADQSGVISSQGVVYVNATGADVVLTGEDNMALAADGLSTSGGVILDGSINNQKLSIMAPGTVKGNLSATSSEPQDLDAGQIADIIPSATVTDKGVMEPLDKRKVDSTEYVFANVDSMLASTDLVIGDVAKTLGYSSYADGGSNRYLIVAENTGTHDAGAFIDLPAINLQARALFIEGEVRIEQWGLIKGGDIDCAPAFQMSIDWCSANGVTNLVGAATEFANYGLASQVQMKEGVYVDLKGQTIFALSDDAGFRLARKAGIRDFIFEAVDRPTWNGPLFLINSETDSNIVNYPRVEFVRCNCFQVEPSEIPNGVMFDFDATTGTRIAGVRATQLIAQNLHTVCKFRPGLGTPTLGWVNSNYLQFDMVFNSKICFDASRDAGDAPFTNNVITATIQPGPIDPDYVISCNGDANEFELILWDWLTDIHPVAMLFGEDSGRNIVTGSFPPLAIRDLSQGFKRNSFDNRGSRNAPFVAGGIEPASLSSGLFGGHQDNNLAYAHLRYDVTAPSVDAGNINNVFTPNSSSRSLWSGVTSVPVEIDLLESKTALRAIGIAFSNEAIPDTIKFEKSTDGVNWSVIEDIVASRSTVIIDKGGFTGGFRYLRFTMMSDVAKDFSVSSIYAWWTGEAAGAYLPIVGGELFGEMSIKKGRKLSFGSSNGAGDASIFVDNGSRLSLVATGGIELNGTRILADQQSAVSDPSGGAVVDAECRSALIAIADRLRNHGLIDV
jgi:hypothetical protein